MSKQPKFKVLVTFPDGHTVCMRVNGRWRWVKRTAQLHCDALNFFRFGSVEQISKAEIVPA